ncbi:MAG TPA: GTP-binding protein [Vicinamibacterales bacterium]|nr:GTP-binding protein [Vicinamibacterales bacterium]
MTAATRLHLVISGHVDHGKSTLVGRLLADTNSLPDGKLDQVRALCERTSKPFEYAFLLDALKDERAQGITIDAARVFFKTATRHYIIIDAPGHIEFLKNLITGAARAEAALLVIDAHEGIQENSRRHATMLSMLGIRQLAVAVNKMDLVGYNQATFDAVVAEFGKFLAQLKVTARTWIPISARGGANVARRAADMPWYTGPTVLDTLEAFQPEPPAEHRPFRLPVQDVYKFTNFADDRRIIAGTVDSGRAGVGDELVFYPSGKRARIQSIEAFSAAECRAVRAGEATGLTVSPQIYTSRGELAARSDEPPPSVTSRVRVNLFWLGRSPLAPRKDYIFKLGTSRVPMQVEAIHRVIDASDLGDTGALTEVQRHQVAECTLKLHRAIAFDAAADLPATGRFVIVDDYDIRGGGIIAEPLPDRDEHLRSQVLLRNAKWISSHVSPERRAERYSQRPTLLVVTGDTNTDRKELARQLEVKLFEEGRFVYFLGMGSVLYGVDADIERGREQRREHLRRLAEIANILLDAGMILIVSAAELTQSDLDVLTTSLPPELVSTVWVGDQVTTDIHCDFVLTDEERERRGADALKTLLEDQRVIFKPW